MEESAGIPFSENFLEAVKAYEPSSTEEELKKFSEALVEVLAGARRRMNLDSQTPPQFSVKKFEFIRSILESPDVKEAVEVRIEAYGSAPLAVVQVFEGKARQFDSSPNFFERLKAGEVLWMGRAVADYIMGVRLP